MAVTRASKLISLTNLATGAPFYLSTNKIIKYTANLANASNTDIKYITQSGKIVVKTVSEDVATIYAAALTNTGGGATYATQAITLVDGTVVYVNNDRVIYVDQLTSTTLITYDEGSEAGVAPSQYEATLPTAANFNSVTMNTFSVSQQPSGSVPVKTRYINNLFIDQVVVESLAVDPVIDFTTRLKTGTGLVSAVGTGYTNPTITVTGGGGSAGAMTVGTKVLSATVVAGGTGGTPGAVTLTGTTGTGTKFQATGTINGSGILTGALVISLAGAYSVPITNIAVEPVTGGGLTGCTLAVVLGLDTVTVTSAGTGYTSYPTLTVVDSTGTTGAVTVQMEVESPLTITNPGSDINTAVTLTFSAGTSTATATATVSTSLQQVTATSLTAAGGYKTGTDAYPTLAITGGSGCVVLYDEKNVEFKKLQLSQTAASVVSAVNAL